MAENENVTGSNVPRYITCPHCKQTQMLPKTGKCIKCGKDISQAGNQMVKARQSRPISASTKNQPLNGMKIPSALSKYIFPVLMIVLLCVLSFSFKNRNDEIDSLNTKIESLYQQQDELTAKIESLQAASSEKQKKIEALQEENEKLKQQLQAKEKQVQQAQQNTTPGVSTSGPTQYTGTSSRSSNKSSSSTSATKSQPAIPEGGGSGATVYITNSGSKYPTATCGMLKKSKIAIGRDKAIAEGYEPCKRCNPT